MTPAKIVFTKDEDERILADYEELRTLSAVAEKWKLNRLTVRENLVRLGVQIRLNKRVCEDDYHPMLGVWSDQMVANDIERKTGERVSRAAVQQARKRRGVLSMTERMRESYEKAGTS